MESEGSGTLLSSLIASIGPHLTELQAVMFAVSLVLLALALFVLNRAAGALERSKSDRKMTEMVFARMTQFMDEATPLDEARRSGRERVSLSGPVQKTQRPARPMVPEKAIARLEPRLSQTRQKPVSRA